MVVGPGRPLRSPRERSGESSRRREPARCVPHDAMADSTPTRSGLAGWRAIPIERLRNRRDRRNGTPARAARIGGDRRRAPGTTAIETRHQRESVRLVDGRFPEGRKMLGAGRSGSRPNRAGDRGRLTRRRSRCCGPHRSGASTAAITAAITRGPVEADWETLGPIEQRLGNWVRFSDSHTLPILPRFARWHIGS